MLPLLALVTGATIGKAEARAAEDKRQEALALKNIEKETKVEEARIEAEAKVAEAAAKKAAEIEAKELARQAGIKFDVGLKKAQLEDFQTYYNADPSDIFAAADKATFSGLPNRNEILMHLGVPKFDDNGDLVTFGQDHPLAGKVRLYPTIIRDSSQAGAAGANAEYNSLLSSITDKQTLNWMKANNQNGYASFKDNLANVVRIRAGGSETPSVQGVTAAVPVILPSTVSQLTQQYGPEFAFEVVNQALVGTGQGPDSIKIQYQEQFGAFPALDAEAKLGKVKTPEGDGVTVSFPDGGGHIDGFDNPDGTLNKEGRVHLKAGAEAYGMTMPALERFLFTTAEDRSSLLGREVTPGEFAQDIVSLRQFFSEYPLYNAAGAGSIWSVKGASGYDQQTFVDFITKYGLFSPNSNYAYDMTILQMLSPATAKSYYPPQDGRGEQLSLLEGAMPTGATPKTDDFYRQPNKQYDQYINDKWSKALGGTIQDFRNKGMAADDAMITLDSLIALAEQQEIPLPVGIAQNIIRFGVSMADQIDGLIDVTNLLVSRGQISEDRANFLRKTLGESSASIRGAGNFEGRSAQEVANALALREFHEGILVYSMAMALQGGNAAARTISDADINRIEKILKFTSGASREERKTIYKALRLRMAKQKAISDSVIGGGEAGLWAAMTATQFGVDTGFASKDLDEILNLVVDVTGNKPKPTDEGQPSQGAKPGDPYPGLDGYIYDENMEPIPAGVVG